MVFPGRTRLIAYGRSVAGEVTSITNQSYQDSGNPAALVSSEVNGPNGPTSYHLGDGLNSANTYDGLGRLGGGCVWGGSTSPSCAGGVNMYGFTVSHSGDRVTIANDPVLSRIINFGYDDFNRLTSRTVTSGASQNFTYTYDRWGNRLQQNVTSGSGPALQYSVNTATNQITTSGYVYDAAGNIDLALRACLRSLDVIFRRDQGGYMQFHLERDSSGVWNREDSIPAT